VIENKKRENMESMEYGIRKVFLLKLHRLLSSHVSLCHWLAYRSTEASCHWGTWGTCPPPRQCGDYG